VTVGVTQQESVGWTAYALKDGVPYNYVDVEADEHARSVFAAAVETALDVAGGFDGFLDSGGVHMSTCREFLRIACGKDVNHVVLTISETKVLREACKWPEPSTVNKDDLPAYWSVRLLLDACVEHGYGLEATT